MAGREGYTVTGGEALYEGKTYSTGRSGYDAPGEGVFLAFQYPVEIPGVSNRYFSEVARSICSIRKHRGQPEMDAIDFLKIIKEKAKIVEMPEPMLSRFVNDGFSGGEKKRNEIPADGRVNRTEALHSRRD